ncbi:virulence protein SciE type [Paraburkholderia ginsengiterrae]|uniref:Virulence protein SciE type n=1 Tax=Paraburkholderia ginsengiterrae TaxID=1462993 RepID=A0A1A9NCF1_9BURK|nr:type VI secretion system accessory protein TagJ [Paraburkholderia ginsengiterrae]OAJ58747.1 virulence protein SciE type [Paraburkholderia ginsengiterrae]OAJ63611.1 virulence protein SciE type [Paraburkholderia ginsengiterrae]
MTTQELLRTAQLDDALAALTQEVRANPADAKSRIFLFQLLAVLGQWERANTQLTVCGELDAGALAMVQSYREALRCEALRAEVFAGRRAPVIFGEPEAWIAMMLEALKHDAEGRFGEAAKIRQDALEIAPATRGTLDGAPFEWIADADARLGPLLELIVNGHYYWVPFHRLSEIVLEAPADLRDTVWMPAHVTFATGGESVAFVPTRYDGTLGAHRDGDVLKLARRTEWLELHEGVFTGLGQRVLSTDAGDYALMDVRQIKLDAASAAPLA